MRTISLTISVLTIAVIVGACWQDNDQERIPTLSLAEEEQRIMTNTVAIGAYLQEMHEKLQCQFTVENPLDFEGVDPWLQELDILPDSDIDTIDDLVEKLDAELEGFKAVRSSTTPSVIHLIAEAALAFPDYVMEENVNVEYSGLLIKLPDHLGALVGGRIGAFGVSTTDALVIDLSTEINVNVKDESVRNVLTDFMPREARVFLWRTSPVELDDGTRAIDMLYYAASEIASDE